MLKLFPVILLSFISLTYADVMYEMKTDYEGMLKITGGQMTIQIFVKGDKSRASISIDNNGEITNSVTIIRFDLNKFWLLDEEKKEYEEIFLNDSVPVNAIDTLTMPEITVNKTSDKKKILDLECEKVIVSMQDTTEGSFLNFAETLWVSSEVPGYEELKNFTNKLTEHGLRLASTSTDGNEKALGEFQKKINEIDGFPLEFSLDVQVGIEDMSFSMSSLSQVTKLEEVPIHDRVFELPEGYVKKNGSE